MVATLKNYKKTGDINFNIFSLTQYIQNIITSTCNPYKQIINIINY